MGAAMLKLITKQIFTLNEQWQVVCSVLQTCSMYMYRHVQRVANIYAV